MPLLVSVASISEPLMSRGRHPLRFMKVFFDTNVYVAEALLGGAAEQMVAATIQAKWRILCSDYVLDEAQRVLTEKLGFSQRFGQLTRQRCRRRANLVASPAV